MTPLQKARKRWPKAEWIEGNGRYASLAHCQCLTVCLFETQAEAERAKRAIDSSGCGGRCYKHHEIVDLGDVESGC
jgi:hypothetical protein